MPYNSYSPNFPSLKDTLASLLSPVNGEFDTPNLKLYEPCDSSQLTIKVAPKITLPVPNVIRLEKELMFATAIDNTNVDYTLLTVERGVGGSEAVAHVVEVRVLQVLDKLYHSTLAKAIIAIEDYIMVGGSSTIIINSIASNNFSYNFSGFKGKTYNLTVSIKASDSLKMTKMFTFTHWDDTINMPEVIESLISVIGTGIDVSIANLSPATNTFDILITGCNGGTAKISSLILGDTE